MRHRVHRTALGRTKEHRAALMANLSAALFRHGRIETTLAKAKALRPYAERVITLAKKAKQTEDVSEALHYRRQALARVRDRDAVQQLFNERADEFLNRPGGYTRIYKLGPRVGDAAEMALIQLIEGTDEGYPKRRKPSGKKAAKAKEEAPVAEAAAAGTATEEAAASAEGNETAEAEAEAPEAKTEEAPQAVAVEEDVLSGAMDIADEDAAAGGDKPSTEEEKKA